MPIVYSTHPLHSNAARLLDGHADLVIASDLTPETLAREAQAADIVIVRANLPDALFAGATKLKAAIRHGAGLDMIPVEAATAAGVLVANVPGVNARSVAEHVVFVALALARRFRAIDGDLRRKGWLAGRAHSLSARELDGATMGIIGMGHLGKAIAGIASAGFGMRVLGHTRRNTGFPPSVEPVTRDELLQRSDHVVLACPLSPETRGMIGTRELALMPKGGFLINVARGAVTVEDDVVTALKSGHLGGAAIDVFAEQPLAADHPFFSFDNVILTPHLAGITEESMERMGIGAVEETLRVLKGDLPVNLVNPSVVAQYRGRFS
ncbi:hydroxyacid dehydrogenase [Nordella sp. HKS 07]|uniref:NAD(P)-dependent oxidoreductase n=1 Tax=Nordella sp. HKS 07 TaxID=2712222 RepID=UPI0013E10EF0|nr:hydroxyacid dehydrogenase [Nordella sp. HKS 07]QIG52060.1 hydroxyacid dehydrogenase [Nordella sp. HKS 07]